MKKYRFLAIISILLTPTQSALALSEINLYFPPNWAAHSAAAGQIANGLGHELGIKIIPNISSCYPEILIALTEKKPVLAYVGSMVQTIIWSRKLGTPLLQAIDHKQFYGGVLLFPKGMSPSAILKDYPAEIAYTVGATSGEVCAKSATGGKASIAVFNQRTAADTIMSGKAKAAFVKNVWWDENKNNYPELDSYSVPEISDIKNADNVLLVSKFVPPGLKAAIMSATAKVPELFNADLIVPFDSSALNFTLELMKKAGINPLTYTWQPIHSGSCGVEEPGSPMMPQDSLSQNKQIFTDGRKVLENKCGICHLIEKVTRYRRKSREQWERTIAFKVKLGAELTEKEQASLINYLLSIGNPPDK